MEEVTKRSGLTPDPSVVSDTLLTKLSFKSNLQCCAPLAGDASNRRYYRLHLVESPVSSLILMQLADPEGFKASEEAVSESSIEITELPFVNVLNHLRQVGVSVPALYYHDEQNGLLYLEDFGDVTLLQACVNGGEKMKENLYSQAVDQLAEMHISATFPRKTTCVAFQRQFSDSLLMWEFNHFLEYGVVARRGKPMHEGDEWVVRKEFQKIAEWMAVQPQVFTHRDYHSRNLMVDGERLGVIDFQDALMGPVTYDLASLLRDSYFELEEDLIDRLIDRYIEALSEGLEATIQEQMLLTDRSAFRRLFDMTSIQRNLKAVGRFVYIDQVKHNPNFLPDIPRTLEYVRKSLEKYLELHLLRDHLSSYVPEWQ
jgi:aminoglycoside/choline kinase family phosphotransferase